jgi:hypothetical protein
VPTESSHGDRATTFGKDGRNIGKRITVPEPGMLNLFGIGVLTLAATRRRKTSVNAA